MHPSQRVMDAVIEPLPVYSPGYCSQCKTPLTREQVIDEHHAWCEACDSTVRTSVFQVPSWTVGVTVALVLCQSLMA